MTRSFTVVCLIAAFAACAASSTPAPAAATSPRLFRFHVDFWANLNQVLLHEALVPRPGYEGPKSLRDRHLVQTGGLRPEEAAQWREGVAYYDAHFTTHNLFDRFIDTLPAFFAAASSKAAPAGKPIDDEWRSHLLAAAPVYRARFWPEHERRARAYIEGMRPLIAAHEGWFANRLVAVYGMPLPSEPIDVEVAPVVPPFGGFTLGEPPYDPPNRALVTLSSEDPSYAHDTGVEMLFHEVSHLLVGRVQKALAASAERQGVMLQPRFWHDVVFYTAGHLTKERLGPGYVPYAERPSSQLFAADEPGLIVLKRCWQPYLDGRVTMDAAIDEMTASLAR